MLIIILVIIFVVYQCLSTKIVQTKQTQLVRAFFTKVSTVTANYEKLKRGNYQGTFNFKGSNVFSSFVCHFSRTLFLISS